MATPAGCQTGGGCVNWQQDLKQRWEAHQQRGKAVVTLNTAGVAVYFPPSMFVFGADEWLAVRGVPEAARWFCPTTVGDVATLRFTGGAR